MTRSSNRNDETEMWRQRREEEKQRAIFDAVRSHLPKFLQYLHDPPEHAYKSLMAAADDFYRDGCQDQENPEPWRKEYNLYTAAVLYEQAYLKADELVRAGRGRAEDVSAALRGLAGTMAVWGQHFVALDTYAKSLRVLRSDTSSPVIEADVLYKMAATNILAWRTSEVAESVKFMFLHAAATLFRGAARKYARGQEILDGDPRTFTNDEINAMRNEVVLAKAKAMFSLATAHEEMGHNRPARHWAQRALVNYEELSNVYDLRETINTVQQFIRNLDTKP